MPKLIILLCFLIALSFGMSLISFSSIPVSNEKVSLETLENNFKEQQSLLGIHDGSSHQEEAVEEIDPLVAGKEIYTGNCLSCHGETGNGEGKIPRLSGQFAWYTVIQLKSYNSGERTAEVDHSLPDLKQEDYKAVSAYIESL